MLNTPRTQLVLVVDDDDEIRDEIIPQRLAELDVRCIMARDIQEAFELAEEHAPERGDPIDLVILDMHLPHSSKHVRIEEEAGVLILNISDGLQLFGPQCQSIIFTAYPSYENCVSSVKAGAYAYIPKFQQLDGSGGGLDELVAVCQRLLAPSQLSISTAQPDEAWLERNYPWLREHYPGRWVTFPDGELAREAGLKGQKQDGRVILSGDSYIELRRKIIGSTAVLRALPPILRVAE